MGLKSGIMPILAVAFILTNQDKIAFYREGIFQSQFKEIDVEVLARVPSDIQLRWMDLSGIARRLLSAMANIVRNLDRSNSLANLTPIDVARGLIAIYERLHPWAKRTTRLSANAIKVRELFKHAKDPNKFLFDDMAMTLCASQSIDDDETLSLVATRVQDGLEELVDSYPLIQKNFTNFRLDEVQVPNHSAQSLAELIDRADNIRQLRGDFRLEAFVTRLSSFGGSEEDIEGIASLAANKPPRGWTDPDLDNAMLAATSLAQNFIKTESFARVKGRQEKRQAMAVVVGVNGRPAPFLEEFEITDKERIEVDKLISQITDTLEKKELQGRNVILAALAEISAHYIRKSKGIDPNTPSS